jgi:hypothetical protein
MAYVYDYLTEEEYKKYNLAELLPSYSYADCSRMFIDRETESLIKKTGVDRDSWGQVNYYIFIP